jgi:ABC-type phosphate/phosphonate transport system substrate-binding protein
MDATTVSSRRRAAGFGLFLALLGMLAIPVVGQQTKITVLRIGASGATTDKAARQKEEAAVGTLQKFIKGETGLNNKILNQKNWRILADKLAKGQLHLGVFEGYEFAWARKKYPELKPLAVAINVRVYPVACIVVQRDGGLKDFAGLRGKSISLPPAGPHHLRVFVERQSKNNGKKAEDFFAKITPQANVEDALDDVVDGLVDAAAVDRTALEAFKRRKPGRFKKLEQVAASQPFPPPVVAFYGTVLDETLRERFREGLLKASRKERGRTLLTLFRVTGFHAVPANFSSVLLRTRKAYPPPEDKTK